MRREKNELKMGFIIKRKAKLKHLGNFSSLACSEEWKRACSRCAEPLMLSGLVWLEGLQMLHNKNDPSIRTEIIWPDSPLSGPQQA